MKLCEVIGPVVSTVKHPTYVGTKLLAVQPIQPDGTPGPGPIPPGPRGTRPASLTTTAAVAGYPIISVPMGLVDGLPVGLQIVGRHFAEPLLLDLAIVMERERPWPLVAPARRTG